MTGNPMPGLPRRTISNYLVAIALVGIALILTANSEFADQAPLALFFAAIVVTTWFGGRNPGILAVVLSVLTADYFILPPKYSFGFSAEVIFPLATFTALTLLTVWLLSSRRQIERSLESTVDRYQLLFENNPVPMWVYDLEDLRFLAVNNAATVYYGFTVREFLSMTIKDIRPPEEIPALMKDLDRTEDPIAFGGPWKHRRKDGSIIEVEITSHELQFEGRRSRLVLAIDVTERRRAQALIGESEARYRTLFDYAPDGILIADTESRYMDANSSICKMLGYSRDELVGLEAKDILVESEVAHVNVALSILRTRSDHQREWQFRRKDGSEFPAEVIATMMPDGNLMAVVRDISERRRAEEDIRASELRFRSLIENSSDAIALMGSDGAILFASSSTPQVLGYSPEELCAFNAFDLIHEDDRKFAADRIELCLSQPRVRVDVQARVLHKDGTWRLLEGVFTNLLDVPNVNAIVNNYRDITERERAEERFRQVIESSPNGMVRVDQKGRIDLVNEQVERSFGYNRDELLGQSIEVLVPARFAKDHPSFRNGFFAHPTTRSMGVGRDLFGQRKDGSEFPVEISLSPLQTNDGMMVLGTIVDITERKRAEERVRRSQEQLAGIIESAMDAIITVDSGQSVILFNSAAEKMFHYSADEAMGKPLDRFIPERFRGAHKGHIQDFGRTQVTRRTMASLGAIFGLRSNGEEFPIEASISQLESDGQKYFTVILRDITERKAAETQNRRLHEMLETRVVERTAELEAANKELEAFSYSVSHDLRAPLRHINGFSQALLEDYSDKLDDVGKGYLDDVRNASQEMGRLIDDVLQLARVTRSEMRRERIDLTNMATVILDELRSQDRGRKVSVIIGKDLVTYGDKRLMGVVLLNLLGNAWKFTANKPDATIEFGMKAAEDGVTYFVRDNGAGFDMAYADKLYGAFQRLHSASEFEGTGIGLATVQRVVHRHGGRVWAEGEVIKGATFYFALPRFKEEDDEGVEG